jgi:hypothetical protein
MRFERKTLEPGAYIQSQCTRCKAVLRHTIVALVEGVPARVKCNTCGGEHVYRPAAPPPSSREVPRERERGPSAGRNDAGSRKSKARRATGMEAEWAAQLASASGKPVVPYSPRESFVKGAVLEHASFGAGVVQRAIEPGKILVLFSSGTKVLVCKE